MILHVDESDGTRHSDEEDRKSKYNNKQFSVYLVFVIHNITSQSDIFFLQSRAERLKHHVKRLFGSLGSYLTARRFHVSAAAEGCAHR